VSRFVRRIPLLIGVLFGLFWATAFLALGRLHGMWPMFEREFPFFIASLLGLHMVKMPWWVGVTAAFVDGALVGVLSGLVLVFLSGRRTK